MFNKLTTDGLEKAEDRLGGFQPFESDIYEMRILNFYAGKSDGGAHNVTVQMRAENGREYRETIYVTNRKGENWFLNKDDKSKKVPLPGFTTVNDLCLAATGKSLSEQEFEEKQVKIYDSEAKRELPKAVQVATEMINKIVAVAILKVRENKNEKQGDEWVPIADERISNTIDKVFDADSKFTVVEATNGAEAPVFYDGWLERNKGKERDNRKIKDGQGGATGAPPKASQAATPKTASIFGKKS